MSGMAFLVRQSLGNCYHCYHSYVYIPESGATGSLTDNEDRENNYGALVNQAYNKLLLFIKNEL